MSEIRELSDSVVGNPCFSSFPFTFYCTQQPIMKTVVVSSKGNTEVRDVPVPEPGAGEVVVKVRRPSASCRAPLSLTKWYRTADLGHRIEPDRLEAPRLSRSAGQLARLRLCRKGRKSRIGRRQRPRRRPRRRFRSRRTVGRRG